MMIWFTPDRVNDPDHHEAYANGAFMLIRRDAYDKIGGHTAVRDRVNEDMHIAALVKSEGLKLRVTRNRSLYLVRMYTSLRGIVHGWSRIFYGTFGTFRRLSISLLVLLVMGAIIGWMGSQGFAVYDIISYQTRPLDDALGYVDLVFAKVDGPFRIHHRWQ
ncbi:hypothetical protein LCGC14_0187150, partial [marine sediment metagenome]